MQENRVHSETLDFQSFAQHRAAGKTKDEQIPQFPPTLKVTGSTPAGRTGEKSPEVQGFRGFLIGFLMMKTDGFLPLEWGLTTEIGRGR